MKSTPVHYIILIGILLCGLVAFLFTQGSHELQLIVSVTTAVAYVAWGMIHHAVNGDLHPKVVVEYALIGTIAVMLLMTITGA